MRSMKLLICTQLVDEKDSTLGFFHAWIAALAGQFESIEVICLQEGIHRLPENVHVHSLGKESLSGSRLSKRIRYVARLWQLIWQLRSRYDAVFVHMNQEYILAVGWIWKLLRKPMYLWRNHYDGSYITDIAATLCAKVFCTSRFSYTAKFRKTKIMPVGVDASILEGLPELTRKPRSVLSIGRISPSKNIHLFIEALGTLHKRQVDFTADVYGKTAPEDEVYRANLIARVYELGMESMVIFHDALPKTETYRAYRTHEISVNASPSGMLDKTMFSGMMHGCLILVSNKDLEGNIPEECSFAEGDVGALAMGLERLLALSENRREEIRSALLSLFERHTLAHLVTELRDSMQDQSS